MLRGKASLTPIFKFIRIVKSFKSDIIHSHMYHANIFSRVSRLFHWFPVLINTVHGIEEIKGLRANIYKYTNALSNFNTVISSNTRDVILSNSALNGIDWEVIYNGVDIETFKYDKSEREKNRESLNIENDCFVWICVGRFEKAKDHRNLIFAFEKLLKDYKNVQLLLVGSGSLLQEIEDLTRELRIRDYIKFLGVKDDVYNWLSSADGYIMSSAWEVLPLVLLEAAAVGLPIVSTDVGGVREVVTEGRNGYLSIPQDAKDLASKMSKLMCLNKVEYEKYSYYGKQHIQRNFTIESIVDKWLNLYNQDWGRKV